MIRDYFRGVTPTVPPPSRASAGPPAFERYAAAAPIAPEQRRSDLARRAAPWVAVIVVAAAAAFAYVHWIRTAAPPPGLVVANGRIEGDEILVAGKRAGRLRELLVREGDVVSANQIVALFDDAETSARVEQARARLTQSRAQAAVAREDAARVGATMRQARDDARRFSELADSGTVPRIQGEHARVALEVAARELAAARMRVSQAIAAEAQARAALDEAIVANGDEVVRAPVAGTVTTKIRSVGEVVAPGTPLVALVDLDRLYLKAYVPETDIGRLRLGLPARVYVDAFPDSAFAATLGYISPRAEFTPREVQTADERVKLVFAIKLHLDANPGHALVPGMPADAVIRWQTSAPWAKPRW